MVKKWWVKFGGFLENPPYCYPPLFLPATIIRNKVVIKNSLATASILGLRMLIGLIVVYKKSSLENWKNNKSYRPRNFVMLICHQSRFIVFAIFLR